jgi:hypothetical protein
LADGFAGVCGSGQLIDNGAVVSCLGFALDSPSDRNFGLGLGGLKTRHDNDFAAPSDLQLPETTCV